MPQKKKATIDFQAMQSKVKSLWITPGNLSTDHLISF